MMGIRSLLFVPADSERKIAKGLASAADALILDLEDSVAPPRKQAARQLCQSTLAANTTGPKLFVRINALDTSEALPDLAAIVRGRPFGIMLPKCQNAQDVQRLADMLSVLEAREDLPIGSTRILPIVTENAASMLGFGSYLDFRTPRLFGMLWGGEDLAADLGATTNRDPEGRYAPVYQLGRSLCLLAATAAGADPIDAVFTDFRDIQGLAKEAREAARSGFVGKVSIHPDQVEVINEAFTPSAAELEHAERVVAAFAVSEGAGVASLDGRMLDRPHHKAALRLLERRPGGSS